MDKKIKKMDWNEILKEILASSQLFQFAISSFAGQLNIKIIVKHTI